MMTLIWLYLLAVANIWVGKCNILTGKIKFYGGPKLNLKKINDSNKLIFNQMQQNNIKINVTIN